MTGEYEPQAPIEPSAEDRRRIARVALFDTVMLDMEAGHCTFDEAIAEFKSAAAEQGIE